MIPERYRKYEKTVTVTCVNFHPAWGDKAANLAKMKANIEEAVAVGSNIIAFPEMGLSGYECSEDGGNSKRSCSMHREAAEDIPGPSTNAIARLTKKYSVYVALSMPEKDSNRPGKCHISTALIGPEGIVGVYQKLHLGSPPVANEISCYTPGNELPVFETRYGPIGILICYDFWRHPELSRILALKGARLIINTTASGAGFGKEQVMRTITTARATENFVYVASANLTGKERTLSYFGCSTIAGPIYPRFAPVLVEASDKEQIISATLNFESLHHYEEVNHWKQERRSDVINREFARLK